MRREDDLLDARLRCGLKDRPDARRGFLVRIAVRLEAYPVRAVEDVDAFVTKGLLLSISILFLKFNSTLRLSVRKIHSIDIN